MTDKPPPRTQSALVTLANQYARERSVPAGTIVKEILHYEILYALIESGAAAGLTFQGGTCLRLCHGGTRYSEDLDFAGGPDFVASDMATFTTLLQARIASAYGLETEFKLGGSPGEHVAMERFSCKVLVPQTDPSLPQKQVINIEIAGVPSHDPDLLPVQANYPHLPAPLRSMVLVAESKSEILADKLVALGGRPYLKFRDLWDIKFLKDVGVQLDRALVERKLADYGLRPVDFTDKLLERRSQLLDGPAMAALLHKEMSRFVDGRNASLIATPALAQRYLTAGAALIDAWVPSPNLAPPSPSLGLKEAQ